MLKIKITTDTIEQPYRYYIHIPYKELNNYIKIRENIEKEMFIEITKPRPLNGSLVLSELNPEAEVREDYNFYLHLDCEESITDEELDRAEFLLDIEGNPDTLFKFIISIKDGLIETYENLGKTEL